MTLQPVRSVSPALHSLSHSHARYENYGMKTENGARMCTLKFTSLVYHFVSIEMLIEASIQKSKELEVGQFESHHERILLCNWLTHELTSLFSLLFRINTSLSNPPITL